MEGQHGKGVGKKERQLHKHMTGPLPADTDRSGQIDGEEAAVLFAKYCAPGSSDAEVKKMASSLSNQIDTDRSGQISFEEYAFRFGRKLQMELARKRRGGSMQHDGPATAGSQGVHQRRPAAGEDGHVKEEPSEPHSQWQKGAGPAKRPGFLGMSRENAMVAGVVIALVLILVVAVVTPEPDDRRYRRGKTRGR